jgi:hypothetical protein
MSKYYQIVVRDQNALDQETGARPVTDTCGHKHRTFETARACYYRLRVCHKGRIPARWLHAYIENESGIICYY